MTRSLVRSVLIVLCLLALHVAVAAGDGEARLLRFADIHEDRIVFVHAGDLWIVPTEGGTARRLTTDEGMELFPKFSPDGRFIAYSAEYGGNRQVWVIPADGGVPRQLTFYNDVGPMPPRGGFDDRVLDWTPDGKQILFRANRLPWGVRMGRPYLVPFEGGMERPLAVPESGGGMLSPDGTKLVYTPIDREFRTWKRYRGGRAQDVWIYDLDENRSWPITDWEGTDNQPVWVGDTILYTSDREGGRLNLWAYDVASGESRQVTEHRDFDVLWPSAGPRQVVYECGGYLYRLDPATGESHRVPVRLTGDFRHTMPRVAKVDRWIQGASLSPSGKRVAFDARGDLFSVPAEHGVTRDLTRSPGVREMNPAWSPDGRSIAYLSDRTGEYEIWMRAADGAGGERRLTEVGGTWLFPPVWSPDSRKLAFADGRQRLRVLDVDSGKIVDIDHSTLGAIERYRWSGDSRWLAYDKADPSQLSSIWIWSMDDGESHRLTDGWNNDYAPVFDPGGRYLYFLSDRDHDLTFSGYEFNYVYTAPTRIYVATLQQEGPALLALKNDEESSAGAEDEAVTDAESDAREEKRSASSALRIDVEGFADRVVALPGANDTYRDLTAVKEGLLFLQGQGRAKLQRFALEGEKVETVLEGIRGYEVSADGKKVLYVDRDRYGIVDAQPGQKPDQGTLDLGGLEMAIDPPEEWRQIFEDAWRITRDWFYDPGMHGVDWPAIRELYEPLVEHVHHRADLDYILGEMGGELSAGHYYVDWGDIERPDRVESGLLGAEIEAHPSGAFRVAKVFEGENWHPRFRSPLTMPGVDVGEGDFILAVDGRPTREVRNVYELLVGRAGRTVTLTVNDTPDDDGARDVQVQPIARETDLRYLDWVRSRQRRVEELSGGRVGYIHLPNTAADGNRELHKAFFPQARKEALILDVRYNGGGFIPDRMIELLARPQLSLWARRDIEPMRTPGFAHVGPKACLINGYSSSGGDAFPYYFRELGLGPLIGRRTWGGLIGLSGNPQFLDGGSVAVPRFRFIDPDGRWAVEGEGVAPDIDVLDRPEQVAAGEDPTLERAVAWLLEELERNPVSEPRLPDPVKIPR